MPKRSKLSRSCQLAVGQTGVTDAIVGSLASQLHFQPDAVAAVDRDQVVIDVEARLEREVIDRVMSESREKRKRRLGREVLGRVE